MTDYVRIEIAANTLPGIPAPYAHTILVSASASTNAFSVSFEQNYHDREGLDLEEVEEEGFSENDDFQWNGTLPPVWGQELSRLLTEAKWLPEPEKFPEEYEMVLVAESENSKKTYFPANKSSLRLSYFLQEIRQAIMETEKMEAPMLIDYLQITSHKKTELSLKGSFANRRFEVSANGGVPVEHDWQILSQLLRLLFQQTESNPDLAISQTPEETGSYLRANGMPWYQLGKGISVLTPKANALENIIKTLGKLVKADGP